VEQFKIIVPNPQQEIDAKEMLSRLKTMFHLKELPSSVKKLKNSPDVMGYVFFSLIQPAASSGHINQHLDDLYTFFADKIKELPSNYTATPLSTDEQSFLYAHLLSELQNLPKYIIIINLILLLCKSQQS
jgi:hypothetical protein